MNCSVVPSLRGQPGSAHRQILSHFVQFFRTYPTNCLQIINAFESAVGFSCLQDFVGRRRADARHLLQFRGRSGIQIDGMQRRLFLRIKTLRRPEHKDQEEGTETSSRIGPTSRHHLIIAKILTYFNNITVSERRRLPRHGQQRR